MLATLQANVNAVRARVCGQTTRVIVVVQESSLEYCITAVQKPTCALGLALVLVMLLALPVNCLFEHRRRKMKVTTLAFWNCFIEVLACFYLPDELLPFVNAVGRGIHHTLHDVSARIFASLQPHSHLFANRCYRNYTSAGRLSYECWNIVSTSVAAHAHQSNTACVNILHQALRFLTGVHDVVAACIHHVKNGCVITIWRGYDYFPSTGAELLNLIFRRFPGLQDAFARAPTCQPMEVTEMSDNAGIFAKQTKGMGLEDGFIDVNDMKEDEFIMIGG